MDFISPQTNSYLLGHENAEQIFLNAWKSRSLHNSWLICGPQGIGKATLAYKIARFLLSADESRRGEYNSLNIAEDSPVFRQVAAGSHPGLKVIERDYTETDKKKIIKAIKDGDAMDDSRLAELKKSAVIRVDDARGINEFLSKSSFEGSWRVVIVDSVDELNTAGANAILKILEEPPTKSILLLVSHNPNRLLATIRSRCAKINLQPLPENLVASLLRRYNPELSEAEVKGTAAISSGSIGRALRFSACGGLEIYHTLEQVFHAGMNFDIGRVSDLCDRAAKDEDIWDLVSELVLKFIADMAKSGEKAGEFSELWSTAGTYMRETSALNMDKKQVLINIISSVCKVF